MKEKTYYTYILANEHKTIYVGVTNNLLARVSIRKN